MKNFLKRLNKDYIIVLLFFVGIFTFLYFTKTLYSGYHFIDDHCLVGMKESLKESSFLKTSYAYIKNDFSIRFRPVFSFYYILLVKIFSLNFFAMSVFMGILGIISFSFFYFGLRNLKFSVLQSTIFILLAFIGSQMAIWWRLGTNEPVGIFFLSLSFFFLSKCVNNINFKLNNALFVVFLTITSLCKESFIFVIPAFIFLKIWLEKENFKISLKESIRKNLITSIFLLTLMFIELLIIKFIVGTNQTGYAGTTSSISEFFNGVKNIVLSKQSLFEWFKFLGLSLIIYFVSFLFLGKEKKEKFIQSIKFFIPNFIFVLLILLPQIFVHAKSGMVERYLLPTTLSLAFLFVVIFKDIKVKFFKFILFIIFSISLFNSFLIAKEKAIDYTSQGKEANFLFETIIENIEKEDDFLLVTDPVSKYEISDSIKIYLSYYGYDNLYVYPILREYKNEFEVSLKNGWFNWFKNKMLEDVENKDSLKMIIIFNKKDEEEEKFFLNSGIDKNNYEEISDEGMPYKIFLKKQ